MDWREFVSRQNTLTLATTNADGSPHACDLFFTHEDSTFYFLSDPKTRHVNFLRDARVSATIHGASQGWQDIRGAKSSGKCRALNKPSNVREDLRFTSANFRLLHRG